MVVIRLAAVLLAASVAIAPTARAADLRVAVARFDNAADDPAYDALGKGLQSMFATDLAAVASLEVVERDRLADILSEIELAHSGLLTPQSAARAGQLLGATHLLIGSFTVVGDGMRLDARLVEVESGTVTLGTHTEGEREAFFELQKDLLQQLVQALELDLSPRERASVARIHTADFDAFATFSQGIDLFDQRRYDDALAALRRASARDEDFKLARLTLAEYERIAAELRDRADTLHSTRDELARLEALAAVELEAGIAQRLIETASRSGESHRTARLTALYLLVHGYGDVDTDEARFRQMREQEDRFAMERMADRFAQGYWAEARALWPHAAPVIGTSGLAAVPRADTYDEDFALYRRTLFPEDEALPQRQRDDIPTFSREMAHRLHLDRRETAELQLALMRDWKALDPDFRLLPSYFRSTASLLTNTLMLDESTAVLRMLADGTDDEVQLRLLASAIETNRDLQAAMDGARDDRVMAEWLMLTRDGSYVSPAGDRRSLERASAPEPPPELLYGLAHRRDLDPGGELVMIGDVPLWLLSGYQALGTGPRTDPARSGSLRFATPLDGKERTALAIVDGVPRESYTVRFELDHHPAPDWWPLDLHPTGHDGPDRPQPADGRPRVGVLVGVRDVDCAFGKDPDTGRSALLRPMHGYVVQFDGVSIRLRRFSEAATNSHARWRAFDAELVEEIRLPGVPVDGPVAVQVRPASIEVQIDAQRVVFDDLQLEPGFQGLAFAGAGYVELSGLRIESP
jgi:TolB-like protein